MRLDRILTEDHFQARVERAGFAGVNGVFMPYGRCRFLLPPRNDLPWDETPMQAMIQQSGIEHLNEMQNSSIARIRSGSNLLIVAPTGSGKTEAALLPVLESLSSGTEAGIRALYITPLRALNRDMIDRVQRLVSSTGLSAAVRHGDTPPSERRKQAAAPPDILITTPETLQAILPGKLMQRHLKNVKYVIIDEVHQLAADRRGIQLAVALERLRSVAGVFQRIGLSATVGHPGSIAALFGGEKPLEILVAPLEKQYEYRVEWPRPIDKDFETARDFYVTPEAAAGLSAIDDTLDESRSTLVFVNARPLAELLGSRLSMLRQDVAVHHGSLPREERERVEAGFKGGDIKGLVSTSTLELGIDIGTVDQVVQYNSPRQVTSLIQRVASRSSWPISATSARKGTRSASRRRAAATTTRTSRRSATSAAIRSWTSRRSGRSASSARSS